MLARPFQLYLEDRANLLPGLAKELALLHDAYEVYGQ